MAAQRGGAAWRHGGWRHEVFRGGAAGCLLAHRWPPGAPPPHPAARRRRCRCPGTPPGYASPWTERSCRREGPSEAQKGHWAAAQERAEKVSGDGELVGAPLELRKLDLPVLVPVVLGQQVRDVRGAGWQAQLPEGRLHRRHMGGRRRRVSKHGCLSLLCIAVSALTLSDHQFRQGCREACLVSADRPASAVGSYHSLPAFLARPAIHSYPHRVSETAPGGHPLWARPGPSQVRSAAQESGG